MRENPIPQTVLLFSVAGARLALPLDQIREVMPVMALEKVPEMPDIVAGFIDIGGEMIPVIRLDRLLRLTGGELQVRPNLSRRIVIFRDWEERQLAFICEPDATLVQCTEAELMRLPAGHSLNECASWVIARKPPEPSIVLLDPERLFLEQERVRFDELRERARERLAALNTEAGGD